MALTLPLMFLLLLNSLIVPLSLIYLTIFLTLSIFSLLSIKIIVVCLIGFFKYSSSNSTSSIFLFCTLLNIKALSMIINFESEKSDTVFMSSSISFIVFNSKSYLDIFKLSTLDLFIIFLISLSIKNLSVPYNK